jgi:hypothetical protein
VSAPLFAADEVGRNSDGEAFDVCAREHGVEVVRSRYNRDRLFIEPAQIDPLVASLRNAQAAIRRSVGPAEPEAPASTDAPLVSAAKAPELDAILETAMREVMRKFEDDAKAAETHAASEGKGDGRLGIFMMTLTTALGALNDALTRPTR